MTVSAEDSDKRGQSGGPSWGQSGGPTAHVCGCIGCCRKCGTCVTAPWHTAEYCRMRIRHAEELAELVREQQTGRPERPPTPGLEYGTY